MISEIQFSTSFSSFWRTHTPHLEHFVRNINLGLTERISPEVEGVTAPERRSLINEIAQRAFCRHFDRTSNFHEKILEKEREAIASECFKYISNLPGGDKIGDFYISDEEWEEVWELCSCLAWYVVGVEKNAPLLGHVGISGYGLLDSCVADAICGTTLLEIKAGSRRFRGVDLKQALVYLVLNASSGEHNIDSVCLLNPRNGVYFKAGIDSFAFAASGKPREELFSELQFFLTAGGVSK